MTLFSFTAIICGAILMINDLLIGIVFLFGSVFVLIGITLQSKMIALLENRYDRVVQESNALKEERQKLSEVNKSLIWH